MDNLLNDVATVHTTKRESEALLEVDETFLANTLDDEGGKRLTARSRDAMLSSGLEKRAFLLAATQKSTNSPIQT